jgi:hypothetical protein
VVLQQGTACLRRSCAACEVRCGTSPPLSYNNVLQFSEQVLVGFPVAVNKQAFGIATLPTFPDGIGEPLINFYRAGLVLLAVDGQGRARQVRMTVLLVGFVVPRHASDKEVQQESFLGVGGIATCP